MAKSSKNKKTEDKKDLIEIQAINAYPDFYVKVGTNEIYHKSGDYVGTIEHEEAQEVFMKALKHRYVVERIEELELFENLKITESKLDELLENATELTDLKKQIKDFKLEYENMLGVIVKALKPLSEDLKAELITSQDIEKLDEFIDTLNVEIDAL